MSAFNIGKRAKSGLNLSANEQDALLRYAATWNTNGRHCHQAQLVLAPRLQALRAQLMVF